MKYFLRSIFLAEHFVFYLFSQYLQEMVHSSECSMAWQTFMKTSSLNSALMNYNTSETSVGSLPDSLMTVLTKAIARHVINGKVFCSNSSN